MENTNAQGSCNTELMRLYRRKHAKRRAWPKHAKKKERKLSDVLLTAFIVFIVAAGVGLLSYPTLSDWWNTQHQSKVLSHYMTNVNNISPEDYSASIEAARVYNQRLTGVGTVLQSDMDAWSEYESLLNPAGTGVMGYVSIPNINVKLPIYHGTSDTVLQVAAGHLYGSSLPVGGEGTHAVLSGHTGLPRAMLFTNLSEMKKGDRFMLQVMGELLTYEVDQIKVVEPTDVSDLQIEQGKDYCTLSTCTPYGVNSHRLLVRGRRVENDPADEEALKQELAGTESVGIWEKYRLYIIAGAAVFAVCLLVAVFVCRKRRRRKTRAADISKESEV